MLEIDNGQDFENLRSSDTNVYERDPNTVEPAWQGLFHVSEAGLRREGSNNFALAHLGR